MHRIQIIEDDPQIRKFLRISLQANGFEIAESRLAEDGLVQCAEHDPDLVILDLGLPDIDGREVIRRLRDWSRVPIIVLSVRSDDAEKVAVLDSGANDYVTKPFSISELMARVRVLLRARAPTADERAQYLCGDLVIDLARRQVLLSERELSISRKEYALLRCLVTRGGGVVTHEDILNEIWGPEHVSDVHYLRVLVNHLRQKLEDDPSSPRYIHTVQGVGYRFAAAADPV
jgi:two-component system, OmpR family, KDP operon response regulator KdpE